MERLREIGKTDSDNIAAKQMTLWPSSFGTEASNNLLVSNKWIEEHSLRPEVAQYGVR